MDRGGQFVDSWVGRGSGLISGAVAGSFPETAGGNGDHEERGREGGGVI